MDELIKITDWINDNSGVVDVLLFLITIILGWVSGIFSTLRQRPKFKITPFPGPTFCCIYKTDKLYQGYEMHRTAIALYLGVYNVGSASSSIRNISVGYHWDLKPFSKKWIKNTLGWFWLEQPTVSLKDFQVKVGENIKVYPFLIQKSLLVSTENKLFLEVGNSTIGIVYFEQDESWGGCYPKPTNSKVTLKVKITDIFNKTHHSKVQVPLVSFEEARKYNPSFGETLISLNSE